MIYTYVKCVNYLPDFSSGFYLCTILVIRKYTLSTKSLELFAALGDSKSPCLNCVKGYIDMIIIV